MLENIDEHQGDAQYVRVRESASELGRPPSLSEFIERSGIEIDDLYRRDTCWSRLKTESGLCDPFGDPDETRLTRGLRRVSHAADLELIRRLLVLLDPAKTPRSNLALELLDDRRLLMLELGLWTPSSLPASPRGRPESARRQPDLARRTSRVTHLPTRMHRFRVPAVDLTVSLSANDPCPIHPRRGARRAWAIDPCRNLECERAFFIFQTSR